MKAPILVILLLPAALAYAHTLDSFDGYRLELVWENNPAYTGEINALVLYVSPLVPGLELADQPFENGVPGLEDTLQIQLVSRDGNLHLFLERDPDTPGKYHAYVNVVKPGYYQANVLGKIEQTDISLSMHPPQVRNKESVVFPRGDTPDTTSQGLREDLDSVAAIYDAELEDLRNRLRALESPGDQPIQYVGLGLGAVAVGLGAVAIWRSRS